MDSGAVEKLHLHKAGAGTTVAAIKISLNAMEKSLAVCWPGLAKGILLCPEEDTFGPSQVTC